MTLTKYVHTRYMATVSLAFFKIHIDLRFGNKNILHEIIFREIALLIYASKSEASQFSSNEDCMSVLFYRRKNIIMNNYVRVKPYNIVINIFTMILLNTKI